MHAPDIRHRHSAPIAKHIPSEYQGAVSSRSGNRFFLLSRSIDDQAVQFKFRSRIFWAIFGFVLGVGFWHLVGFWSFIGDVMLTGDSNSSRLMSRLQQARLEQHASKAEVNTVQKTGFTHNKGTNSLSVHSTNLKACTQLILDRKERRTYSSPCTDRKLDEDATNKLVKTASSHSQTE